MKLESPADLLALIPTLIGRKPEEVLVLLTFNEGRMQAVFGLEHAEPDHMPEYIAAIIKELAEIQPEAIVTVFYTEEESDCQHLPFEHVNILLMLALEALTPLHATPGMLVKGGQWTVYGSGEWHPMEEVKESELAAALVLHGIQLDQPPITAPEPTAVTDEVIAAIDEEVARLPKGPTSENDFPLLIEKTWVSDQVTELRALYEELLDRGFGATEAEAIRIIAALQVPVTRDRLMVDTVSKTMDVLDFGQRLSGNHSELNDPRRLEAAASLMTNLMQWTTDRHRLPLLLVQSWLHWMQGRYMDATTYLELALELDPTYRLAYTFGRYIKEVKRMPSSVRHERHL